MCADGCDMQIKKGERGAHNHNHTFAAAQYKIRHDAPLHHVLTNLHVHLAIYKLQESLYGSVQEKCFLGNFHNAFVTATGLIKLIKKPSIFTYNKVRMVK